MTTTPLKTTEKLILDTSVGPLVDIGAERARQETLKANGRFSATCADDMTDPERFIILDREVGEVARAVHIKYDRRQELLTIGRGELRKELIQVAAVALAWVEAIDRETANRGK